MNKKIVLDFEANFDSFKRKIQSAYEDVAKYSEQFLGKDTNDTSRMSFSQRQQHEQRRYQDAQKEFYNKYSKDDIKNIRSGAANPFDQKTQAFNQGEKMFQQWGSKLQENTNAINHENVDQANRHKDYRNLSERQLRAVQEELKIKAVAAMKSGDIGAADKYTQERRAAENAQAWRENVGGNHMTSQERFQRQFAKNLFIDRALSSTSEMLGGDARTFAQIGQGGFNSYSAARMSGMSGGGAAAVGATDMALNALLKFFMGGENVQRGINKAGATLDQSQFTYNKVGKDGKTILTDTEKVLGLGGVEEQQAALEQMINLSRGSMSGKNINQRFLGQKLMEKSMGISDDQAFNKFYQGSGSMESASGVYIFTKMLEKLDTGVTFGDDKGVGKDLSQLPKYLSKLASLQEQTFKMKGEVTATDSLNNMRFLTSAMGMGGIFSNPDNAAELMGGVQAGFAHPSDPLHRYKNVRAVRQVMGNVSPVELAKVMEDLSSAKDASGKGVGVDIAKKFISNLENEYGGQKNTEYGKLSILQDFQNAFHLPSLAKAEEFYNRRDKLSTSDIEEISSYKKGGGEFEKNVQESMVKATKELTTGMESLGHEFTSFADVLRDKIFNMIPGVGGKH